MASSFSSANDGVPAQSLASLLITSQLSTRPIPPPPSTSFHNQTALVTGSNAGLGFEACRQLLKHGLSHLIMGVRSVEKGKFAATKLRAQFPDAKIDIWELDMTKYSSVESFARQCETLPRLDVAILNAGCIKPVWNVTEDRHEEVLQVNYLATALLGFLLLPILRNNAKKQKQNQGTPARLTFVTSLISLTAEFKERDEEDILKALDKEPKRWDPETGSERYKVTKLFLIMLVKRLGGLVDPEEVIVNAVDPALVSTTGLQGHMPFYVKVIARILGMVFWSRSEETAVWTYLDAVSTKGKESHGEYLMNWKVSEAHAMMYTEAGKKTMDKLWNETVEELGFAGVKGILDGLKSS
ncbi:hypothetical protein QBC43DRAFT_373540 [Cladorrhinum sp. PSN259]|nr:hypothetical protein QBC43DRAFT_373540 [Cladorrhinum sp. PSN259]